MVGSCGRGAVISAGKALQITVRMEDESVASTVLAARLQRLQADVECATALKVKLLPWVDSAPPDDATEILFAAHCSPNAHQENA